IANTIKGKGVSFMEGVVDFHGRAPTEKEKEIALKELENIENK
ncbi:MAG: transketolase, partial [Candidatus Omnitrophica bacterium]|nr:transketolase [Candidatus Omnitrophota bacterium]